MIKNLLISFPLKRMLLVALGFIPALNYSQVLLYSESFETNGEGVRYNTNTYFEAQPACNFFARLAAAPLDACFGPSNLFSGFQGSFFWGSEDIMRSGTPLPPGQITSSLINIPGYGSLQVSLYLATANNLTPTNSRWETADSINIKASINGAPYTTVGRFMGTAAFGGDLINDLNLNGVFDGGEPVVSLAAFTQYTFNISGTGSNLRIMIDCDQIGGSEELGLDLIRVTGVAITPVNWAGFSAQQMDKSVLLNWATEVELNAASFHIERMSGDGTFNEIATMPCNGFASSYQYKDENVNPGLNYYRIRQVDFDNTTSYSETVSLVYHPPYEMKVYPNPAGDKTYVNFGGDVFSGELVISELSGKQVASIPFASQDEIEINTSALRAGIYLVSTQAPDGTTVIKRLAVTR